MLPDQLGIVWKVSMPTSGPCQPPHGALQALSDESSSQSTSLRACSLLGNRKGVVTHPGRSSSGGTGVVCEGMDNHQ